MAYTTVSKATDYFNTKLYTGNGSTNAQTGVGFQPDMVWFKSRTNNTDHAIFDAVRGVTKEIRPNKTDYEDTAANGLTAFGTDGFTLGDWSVVNLNAETFVSWNWRAGAGAGSSNTDGSINTTSTSVNTTSGFSISKYTGTGSVATIGHGLGVVPAMIIVKRLSSSASDWRVYHSALGNTKQIFLNTNGAQDDDNTIWNDTSPTSSVFTVGTNAGSNASGETYVAYCWAEKTGFSRFGQYLGNGNTDGTFVYTGFRPAFVLVKKYSATESWQITDNARDVNVAPNYARLISNGTDVEATNTTWAKIQKASNGFKLCHTDGVVNASGSTYIYMAFADAPLVGSNDEPCKAR